jgi:hypothetical protein
MSCVRTCAKKQVHICMSQEDLLVLFLEGISRDWIMVSSGMLHRVALVRTDVGGTCHLHHQGDNSPS